MCGTLELFEDFVEPWNFADTLVASDDFVIFKLLFVLNFACHRAIYLLLIHFISTNLRFQKQILHTNFEKFIYHQPLR